MCAFHQQYKAKKSWTILLFGLLFLAIPIDAEFFSTLVPEHMRQDAPWFFWSLLAIGGLTIIGAARQLRHPPLIIAADAKGLTLGWFRPAIDINLSPRNFGIKGHRARSQFVPWARVREISVGEVTYTVRNSLHNTEPALRIEFDDPVDLKEFGDMQAMQAGTAAYFWARAQRKGMWRETGGSARANIVLIGEQHFDENVNQVCDCLRKLAAKHADSELSHSVHATRSD
jgi:hypothetical protein